MAIPGKDLPRCMNCGKKGTSTDLSSPEKTQFTKCIKCGKVFCDECWQPEYWEICPRCAPGECC